MASNCEDMLVKEASVKDLVDALGQRCVTLVLTAHVPDDGDVSGTLIVGTGNRAACLGLADVLREVMLGRILEGVKQQLDTEDGEQ